MAYKALYRTYRPNSFAEVAGQKHVVQTLENAVQQNKIAHAYLFCGPRGTGKTSIAKIFAKSINCESDTYKPCMECENCKASLNGTHPDIIEIDAASNNGVEEVRSLIEKVKYAPLKGKYKVYIIDEVHMMSTGAFNALLKTIEEPPAHIIFILATTEPHKVLPTIISRCQRFDFTKVSKTEIIERIHTVLSAENIRCDEEVVKIIAQLADGGLRDALSILDQCIAYAKNDLKLGHINDIYGITTVKEKLTLLSHIINKEPVDLLNMIDTFVEKGIDIKRLTEDLIELIKETIIFEYTKDATLLHQMNSEEALNIIQLMSIKNRFVMINRMMESYDKYRFAASVSSYFEVCMLEMLGLNDGEDTLITNSNQNNRQQISHKHIDERAINTKNVSRETFYKESTLSIEKSNVSKQNNDVVDKKISKEEDNIPYIEKPINPLDSEFVLALLTGATKPEKANDVIKFKLINDYLSDLVWARFASLLRNVSIVGSGDNYIVISVDSSAEANEINEVDSNNEFHDFIIKLLGKNKKLFAISKDQTSSIILAFKERMENNTLPVPISIEDVIINTQVINEPTQEETIVDLFGKENIIIKED